MTARQRAAGDVEVVHSLRIDCHRVTFTDTQRDTFLAELSDRP
ncbi:hypothetical protein [Kineosporia sp. NBRC 101731]|nr:hypothetical protein [Kineosporia sp. NBRC 101731]